MKALAVIPARGGSKRIPGKNIRNFEGKPIIAYSIKAVKNSGLFDGIMVSTDSPEIAEISIRYGAEVPFLRDTHTSDDHATLADAVINVLHAYRKKGIMPEYVCCVLATAPLLTSAIIAEGYTLLTHCGYDAVMPVVNYGYPVQRSLEITDGKLLMCRPEYKNTRSQDLPERFHDAGQFYWIKTEILLKTLSFFTENTGALLIDPVTVQDIDTEKDWQLAEIKYRYFNRKK